MSAMEEESVFKTLLAAFALALFLICWGFLVYYLIGDRQTPEWFYGSQQDVPGQSPYSTERSRIFPGTGPLPFRAETRPQHVDDNLVRRPGPFEPYPEDTADGAR